MNVLSDEDLQKYFDSTIIPKITSSKGVAKAADNIMIDKIRSNVYAKYKGTSNGKKGKNQKFSMTYKRRGELMNIKNIENEYEGDVLELMDVTKSSPSVINGDTGPLSLWVEEGSVKNIFNERDDYAWAKARPFTEDTATEIGTSSMFRDAVLKELSKYGLKTIK